MKTQANSIRFQILLARNSNSNPRDKPVVGFPVSIDPAEGHHGCEVVSRVGIWNSTTLSFRLAEGFTAAASIPKKTLKLGARERLPMFYLAIFTGPLKFDFAQAPKTSNSREIGALCANLQRPIPSNRDSR